MDNLTATQNLVGPKSSNSNPHMYGMYGMNAVGAAHEQNPDKGKSPSKLALPNPSTPGVISETTKPMAVLAMPLPNLPEANTTEDVVKRTIAFA